LFYYGCLIIGINYFAGFAISFKILTPMDELVKIRRSSPFRVDYLFISFIFAAKFKVIKT